MQAPFVEGWAAAGLGLRQPFLRETGAVERSRTDGCTSLGVKSKKGPEAGTNEDMDTVFVCPA